MRAGAPIIAVFPQRLNRPLQQIFVILAGTRRMQPWV
jgi:hypothetical protein